MLNPPQLRDFTYFYVKLTNMRPLFIITLFVFSSLCFGQIDKEKAILQKLCSKEFAGRGYVNNGVNLAADFIADEFSKAKALPAGEDGTYFHHFSLNVNTIPEKADVLKLDGGIAQLIKTDIFKGLMLGWVDHASILKKRATYNQVALPRNIQVQAGIELVSN